MNGIGERAGNASLEEIVMLLRTRRSSVGLDTGIVTREIARTSRLVSRLTGYPVQPNKAIVGRNAFAHEAGIHQDGVLKDRTTYEIMDATTIGLQTNSIVLGKHSGRHALRNALEELGVRIDGQALNTAFKRFKEVADRKKHVTALDLEAIVSDEIREQAEAYNLARFELHDESGKPPTAKVEVTTPAGETVKGEGTGDGAIDALLQAINAATGIPGVLKEYHVAAVTADTDALGEVSVLVEHDGRLVSGQSVSTDTLEASARAYLRALSNALAGVGADHAPVRGGSRSSALAERDFTWIDGERLIRFGAAALDDAPALLAGRGFEGYALLTTPRAARAAPALVEGAEVVLDVPAGGVPEAAAAVRDGVGGPAGRGTRRRPGRRCRQGDRRARTGCAVAAVPTTLSGAELTPFHRMPAGVSEFRLVRPALVVADPGADGLPADARPGRERDERSRACGRGALHAAGESGRRDGGAARGRADRRGPAT